MEPFTVIILAGGKSSRMGSEKGLVLLDGQPLIARVLETAKSVSGKIIVISAHDGYKKFGYPVIADVHENCGPMGGIHSGLSRSETSWNLVLGCDMPFVTSAFIRFLSTAVRKADAVVPVHDGSVEPLCAFYHKSAAMKMESLLLNKEWKMQEAVKGLETVFHEVPRSQFDPERLFKNMNTPADIRSSAS